tara:strand:+ start:59 stop:748 length:690 start_codon:yes stop_codon:yes gene_type:complete
MPAGDIKVLEKVMNDISEATDKFIVLSTHDDVDVLTPKEEKQKIINVLIQHNFHGLINEPRPECLYYAEPQIQFFKEPDFKNPNLANIPKDIYYEDENGKFKGYEKCHIDLQTGLYYKGLVKHNVLVPVDLRFQNYVYDTRIKTNDIWKYTLSPEAEVVHTVCRVIWDKKHTPPHYKERLDKAIDKCDFNKLSYAFEIALFKFGEKALELVKNRQYRNLFEEYITYTNY